MKSTTAQNGDWNLSYDSLAAARCRRKAKNPPNAAKIVIIPPHTVGVGVLVVGGFNAGFTPGVLINITYEFIMEAQRLSTELLVRGHTTYGSYHQRFMRLRMPSPYEINARNLRRSLDFLLDRYMNLFVSGGDTRYIRSEILAHHRILKTDSILPRKR